MNINTAIAKNICVADEKAGYDAPARDLRDDMAKPILRSDVLELYVKAVLGKKEREGRGIWSILWVIKQNGCIWKKEIRR